MGPAPNGTGPICGAEAGYGRESGHSTDPAGCRPGQVSQVNVLNEAALDTLLEQPIDILGDMHISAALGASLEVHHRLISFFARQ